MTDEPLDLADFLLDEDLPAEIVAPGAHMPTADAAVPVIRVAPEQICKRLTGAQVADVIANDRCAM